jgi:hypothetical protein
MAFQQKILYHNKREKSIAQLKNSHIYQNFSAVVLVQSQNAD